MARGHPSRARLAPFRGAISRGAISAVVLYQRWCYISGGAISAVVLYQRVRRWIEHAPTECRRKTSGYPDSPETVGISGEGRQNREDVAPFHASAARASAARPPSPGSLPCSAWERADRRSAPAPVGPAAMVGGGCPHLTPGLACQVPCRGTGRTLRRGDDVERRASDCVSQT
jgi:hypothetical protein